MAPKGRYSRACAVALGLAAMVAARDGLAEAAQAATRLDYGATLGCPGAPEFEAVVVGRLGYDPFRKGASERVIVRIDPAGKALQGHFEWRDASGGWIGEQAFPSRTGNCAELVRAMGFALAVQFQMMAVLGAEPPALSTLPPPPSPPVSPAAKVTAATTTPSTSTTPAAPTTASPPATSAIATPTTVGEAHPPTVAVEGEESTGGGSRSPRPSFTAGAGAAVEFTTSTSLIAGRLFGTVGWPRVAFELAGELSAPSVTRRADGAGFEQQELLVAVAGCGLSRPWSACLLAKVGQIRVAGRQIDVPATPTALMVQAGARLGLTQTFWKRFEVTGHLDGLTRVVQAVVTLDSFTAGMTPRFALALGLDVAVRFP